ncbi:uncharacterized protein LOC130048259 [Ostrea edulis]|uniref:uncharacterized protein LOC130048259 n=1 Tax=Ostrea edulis TaxID=37623 RepID=UPI0024AEB882|nr:uncharacterized protein LOC130048259 [Ostrea edulis]
MNHSYYNASIKIKRENGCELNGRCLKPNEQVQSGCAAYKCDPSGYLMVIDMLGCVYDGECKAINSTWFDPKTCTTYTCVYDSDVHDISIVEKTGCKGDNGRCFTTGEGTVEGCNKYLCSETSNFKPTQIRCEFQGECKEIDSTWTEGCITYTCKLIARGPDYVQTKVIESHGCVGENGHCYKVGDDIIQRGCSRSTCKPGGIVQETEFGCIGPNDQCMDPGSKIVLECVTYVCDGEAKSLVPIGKGCIWNGECKPVDTKWFDKETCRGYTCAMDIADNDVKIIERTIGCTVDGKCKRSRTSHMKDCVQYRCTTRGELIPKKISCEWDGECKDVGSTWTKNCIHYKCVITQEGPDYVQTEVIQRRGCIDSYGRCHSVMDEVSFGCNKYRCEMGGSMVLIASGCMDRYGRCMKPGELVEELDGSTHKCVCDGSSCVVVTEVKGCKLNGTLYPFGHTMKEGCTVYECQKYDRCGMYVPIQWGCYWVDRCYSPGDKWKSEKGCSIYTCTMNQKPNGDVDMIVSRDIGCPHDDECKLNGEVWRDGCFEKKCKVRNTKDGSRESSIKIISGACQEGLGDGMICHSVGSIWEEQHYDGCFKKQCSKDQVQENKYITTIIGSACRDAYGACRPVGSTGFSAYVNGQLNDDCKCSAVDGDVKTVKYECGGPEPIMCQQDC